jgi:hypothetical protein
MKEEVKNLNPIVIEVDDKLEEHELFTGISAFNTDEGQTVFVGLVEKWEAARPIGKRYVNIKAKHLKPKNDTFTKEDLKVAFEQARSNTKSFDDWFKFNYENDK